MSNADNTTGMHEVAHEHIHHSYYYYAADCDNPSIKFIFFN